MGLELKLVPGVAKIALGQKPSFQAIVTNTADEARTIVRSRDGSDVGWVIPALTVEITGPDHRPVRLGAGRCGVVNRLIEADIILLKPGSSFDVIGEGTFGHHMLRAFHPTRAGSYRYRFIYDATEAGPRDEPARKAMLKDVTRVQLHSATVTITVVESQ